MVKLLQAGRYKLEETAGDEKVLTLDDNKSFLWTEAKGSGNLKYVKLNSIETCCLHAMGNYRLYNVKNEQGLLNGQHINFHTTKSIWRGFLLPSGLPTQTDKTKKILRTTEVITKTRKRKI